MTHDELLDFAVWAAKRIEELEVIERETGDDRIMKEIRNS